MKLYYNTFYLATKETTLLVRVVNKCLRLIVNFYDSLLLPGIQKLDDWAFHMLMIWTVLLVIDSCE